MRRSSERLARAHLVAHADQAHAKRLHDDVGIRLHAGTQLVHRIAARLARGLDTFERHLQPWRTHCKDLILVLDVVIQRGLPR